jgi:hypothetical protein
MATSLREVFVGSFSSKCLFLTIRKDIESLLELLCHLEVKAAQSDDRVLTAKGK